MIKKLSWYPVLPLVLAALGASTSVFAGSNKMGPCRQDAEKLCSGLTWGKGLGKCMKEHKSDLSNACQAKLEKGMEKHKEFSQACGSDLKQYCSDIKPGQGRVRDCLKDNEQKLSSSCKDELSRFKNKS
jgi:hypothetical protein